MVRAFLGFQDLEIDADEAVGVFRARCVERRPSAEPIAACYGYWALYRRHWMVVFEIRHRPVAAAGTLRQFDPDGATQWSGGAIKRTAGKYVRYRLGSRVSSARSCTWAWAPM